MAIERNLQTMKPSFDTTEASELSHRLREWVAPITKASWALDSALHNLRVANEKGTTREIGDALMAAIIARQAAAQMWAKVEPELVRAANSGAGWHNAEGYHLFPDGNMWCAVGPHFRDLQQDHAGFGSSPQAARMDLINRLVATAGRSQDVPKLMDFTFHR